VTETPLYDQLVSEHGFDPLAFPAEDVDAAPKAATGSGAADPPDAD